MSTFAPLTLGTVQLGMPYGIANASGQPDLRQGRQILQTALALGFGYLDTAPADGTSEETLGKLLPEVDRAGRAQVISKIPGGLPSARWEEQLSASLGRLQRPSLHAWLLHDETDFARLDATAAAVITAAQSAGHIGAFGVSCYSVEVALAAMRSPLVTALQVPANVFDRRFLDACPANEGVFMFVRSVFLQGLCLMTPEQVPPRLPGAVEGVRLLRQYCCDLGITPQAFCLHYVNHRLRGRRHSLVLGVETAAQVEDLVQAMSTPGPADAVFQEWERLWPHSPPEMINPGLWPPYRQP